ncbi:YciI family protein [Variovorax sp. J22R24]|uniref:YciI family protein n=1 Tax=Variovorax gracilis TaxID=3053502 RepID=UPI0025753E8E|nr:YciI family protein [Variovorax sp. J22R24]MDM0105955.1 YciI family protein [Variovorax sp. J22R24]
MRFMIIRKADKDTEAGMMPTEQLVTDMLKYNEEMIKAGVMFDGMGLQPSAKGARIRFRDGKPSVIDGPFAEAKELIAGITLIQVKSREEALEWVKRWPAIDGDGNVELELRQIYEAEDFGAEFTPEIRKQEELLRGSATARDTNASG